MEFDFARVWQDRFWSDEKTIQKKSPVIHLITRLLIKSAHEWTRTITAIRPLHPECSASTNSATWAIKKNRAQGETRTRTNKTLTWPSTMRVYQFRHLGNILKNSFKLSDQLLKCRIWLSCISHNATLIQICGCKCINIFRVSNGNC